MDKIFIGTGLKKLLAVSTVKTDNIVFQLHYKLTTLILIAFSLTVSAYQFFGNPIMCISNDDFGKHKDNQLINTYCWIESTFSLPKAFDKTVGEEVPYPGVDKEEIGDEVIKHTYYQWVCFFLFLQGCMFFVTRLLWKRWEGGKIKTLISGLNNPIMDCDAKFKSEACVINYFVGHKGNHSEYAYKYFACEIINFINVICQIYFIDTFLGGEFTTYGPKVFSFLNKEQEYRSDPMVRVFPHLTKCTFRRFGPSGDLQQHDIMCILPLNIVNEKIFVALWLWLVVLAVLSAFALAYRVICIGLPHVRCMLTKSTSFLTPGEVVEKVLSRLSFGDWFVLYQLKSNIDNVHYRELMVRLSEALDETTETKL